MAVESDNKFRPKGDAVIPEIALGKFKIQLDVERKSAGKEIVKTKDGRSKQV